jgi:hypothetical protein
MYDKVVMVEPLAALPLLLTGILLTYKDLIPAFLIDRLLIDIVSVLLLLTFPLLHATNTIQIKSKTQINFFILNPP